jgi:hypothetical protein
VPNGQNELARQLQSVRAWQEIANLQARYLYYAQAHDYDRVLGLFDLDDSDVSVEISSTGVYVGRDKVRTFFLELIQPLFTAPGSLPIHMLNTPCIEVAPDGLTASGMWQTLGCNAFSTVDGMQATWQQGKYDNTFNRRGERWLFKQFRWLCNFRTPFDQGWVKNPMTRVEPLDLTRFPDRCHPSRPSEPYPGYDPSTAMDFGPYPPEPSS